MTDQMPVTFADIEQARAAIRDHVYKTPLAYSATLSASTGCRLHLKLENLQMTGSFKERGAANRLGALTESDRARGIVAASAGNHAQGVAYHAARLGVDAVIAMPEYTPLIKVSSTKRYGARVQLEGMSYDDAYAVGRRIEADENRVFIHAFDDPLIIAGQGTVGLELLEQNPYLDAVVVPVGGGGLLAGIAVAIKETNPRIKVYGVEAAAMPGMTAAIDAGGPVEVPSATTMADGIAVRKVGTLTHRLIEHYVDGIVAVGEEEIASAILTLLEVEKTMVEGAGATPLAAIARDHLDLPGQRVALVLSGGNIDVTMLSRIIERGLVKDGRMAQLSVAMPDSPGSLAVLTQIIAGKRGNVLDIRHDRAFLRGPLGTSLVTVTLSARGSEHLQSIVDAIAQAGMSVSRA